MRSWRGKIFFQKRSRVLRRNIQGQVFRNRTDLRTWFIQNFRLGDNLFNNVQVLQQDAQGQYRHELFGRSGLLSA